MISIKKAATNSLKFLAGITIAGKIILSSVNAQTFPDTTSKILYTIENDDGDSRTKQLVMGSFDGFNDKIISNNVNNNVAIKVSPNGSKVATINKADELVIMNLNEDLGDISYKEYAGSSAGDDLTWDTDNSLYFGVYTPGIYQCMPPGYPQKIIKTPGFRYFHNPTPNPFDDNMLSVLHEWSTRYHIYLSNKDGTNLEKIFSYPSTSHRNENLDFSWIDKENFIFKNGRIDAVYYMNAKTKEVKKYNFGQPFNEIELSPNKEVCAAYGDGQLFFFETSQLGENEIKIKRNLRVYDPRDFAWAKDSKHYAIIDRKYDKTVSIRVYDMEDQEFYFPNDSEINPLSISWNGFAPKDLALITNVEEKENVPLEFRLMNAYPNPFNPSTTVSYELPHESDVNIAIYSALGQKVREISTENQKPGVHKHQITLDDVSSGPYFLKIDVENQKGIQSETQKLLFLK